MGQIIVNPDAHVETSTVDGSVEHDDLSASLSWHQIVTAAGSDHDDDSTSMSCVMLWASAGVANKWRRCSRVIMLFDTSSIPDDATVSSATLQVYGRSKFDGLPCTPDVCVYASNPTSDDDLINTDYATLGTTELSNVITYGAFDAAGWNTFTINGAGLALINKTGITKFGLRNANYDVADELDPNNHDPTWNGNNDSFLVVSTAEEAGEEPILTVNYTEGGGAGGSSSQGAYFARRMVWRGSGL